MVFESKSSYMAKTNPIGVRFDIQMLEKLKEDGINTPQKVLNFLANYYTENIAKINFRDVIGRSKGTELPNKIPENKEPEIDETEIEKQISAIYAEKIPKERDTSLGRKVWASDQRKRISELEERLKGSIEN